MRRASKLVLVVVTALTLNACGYHFVSYDPKEVAGVAQQMRESFRNYRKILPVPENLSASEKEDIEMLGDAFDENASKLIETLSK